MKRTTLVSAAVISALALAGCTAQAGAGTPSPTPVTTPSAVPTSTVTPSASPVPASVGKTTRPTPPPRSVAPRTVQPSPSSPGEISGAIGKLPDGFTLPDEDRPGDGEVTAFTTSTWRVSCPDRVLTLASASGIKASRIKESVGPGHVIGNGLLVFRDEAAATAFVTEVTNQLAACTPLGPDEEGWRTVQASESLTGLGDQAVTWRQWTEWNSGGSWVEAPGAGLHYVARKGPFVALTFEAGEYVGDPAALPELVNALGARIATMLGQV